jgi:hypothetical protein
MDAHTHTSYKNVRLSQVAHGRKRMASQFQSVLWASCPMDDEVSGLAEDLTGSTLPLGTAGLIQMGDSSYADFL